MNAGRPFMKKKLMILYLITSAISLCAMVNPICFGNPMYFDEEITESEKDRKEQCKREEALKSFTHQSSRSTYWTKKTLEAWVNNAVEEGEEVLEQEIFSTVFDRALDVQRKWPIRIEKRNALGLRYALGKRKEVLKKEVVARSKARDYYLKTWEDFFYAKGNCAKSEDNKSVCFKWMKMLIEIREQNEELVQKFCTGLLWYEEFRREERELGKGWMVIGEAHPYRGLACIEEEEIKLSKKKIWE